MRPPTILDLVQAIIEVAPSHPEVAVWWYTRAGVAETPPMLVVLEPGDGAIPDPGSIGLELARRLGPDAVAVRLHHGAGEARRLYRLLTTEPGRAVSGPIAGS